MLGSGIQHRLDVGLISGHRPVQHLDTTNGDRLGVVLGSTFSGSTIDWYGLDYAKAANPGLCTLPVGHHRGHNSMPETASGS